MKRFEIVPTPQAWRIWDDCAQTILPDAEQSYADARVTCLALNKANSESPLCLHSDHSLVNNIHRFSY